MAFSQGQNRIITRKEYRRPSNEFEMGGFMAQKGPWNLVREMLQDRGALPKEEGDIVRKYKGCTKTNS